MLPDLVTKALVVYVGAALCIAIPATTAAASSDKIFTIANYPVDASAQSAVAAKDKALADGQQAAFRSLLKRIVPVTAYKQLSRLQSTNAADLVSGVSIRSERNSATDYIANLDFSFQSDAVRGLLSSQGVPFVDEQAEAVTVVPVLRQGNPPVAANDTSLWFKSWQGLDLKHSVTPVTLEALKPAIANDTISMLINGDSSANRILNQEYGTSLVVVAIVEPDFSAKKMVVTLAGQDAVGPINLKRSYRIADGDVAYASELAAVVALGILEGRWKAIKSAAGSGIANAPGSERPVWAAAGRGAGEPVHVVVEFSGSAQWNDIRTQLLDTPGVEDLEIGALLNNSADVSLRFPGGAHGLANAVGSRGLTLANSGQSWILRAN